MDLSSVVSIAHPAWGPAFASGAASGPQPPPPRALGHCPLSPQRRETVRICLGLGGGEVTPVDGYRLRAGAFVTRSFMHIVSNPHAAPGAVMVVPMSQTGKLRLGSSPGAHPQSPRSAPYSSALPRSPPPVTRQDSPVPPQVPRAPTGRRWTGAGPQRKPLPARLCPSAMQNGDGVPRTPTLESSGVYL